MKRLFTYLIIVIASVGCYADDYGFLTFEQQSGTKKSIPALGTRITFVDGQALATYGSETYEVSIADLAKMYFSPEDITTGIETVPSVVAQPQQGEQWFTPDGRQVSNTSLCKGIYIVRKNGQTLKTIIK